MRILIIGSGGREHALAWKLRQRADKPELFIAPGNGGTALEGENVPVPDGDIPALMRCIREKAVDFVIPGPELSLVRGIVDACREAGVPCFGPERKAAMLEGSKAFAKEIMREAGVPTADFRVFDDHDAAARYVRERNRPLVIKADGLAAGKGVVVAEDAATALNALRGMMIDGIFGPAGETVLIEELLTGEEVSFLAFCQGEAVVPLPSAQDHKAVFDGDAGPNTGGMGAYSPAPLLSEDRHEDMARRVIRPVLRALRKRGCPFSGVLYAGLMMTGDGPKVLEFNTRFGDPECQPLLMRLEDDLLDVMLACARGRLEERPLRFTPQSSLCVVLAARGYPGGYPSGMIINGIDRAEESLPGMVKVFQAGTRLAEGSLLASGGRVLGVTALGADLGEARHNAYAAMEHIRMEHGHFRRDIGARGLR
ncbi:MAG: phosphoribosylamine--glycine ligase [Desulfovibrio sp.]|nr:phosphoribosylamine--glycine ligase [Desulfovibrio sp.]